MNQIQKQKEAYYKQQGIAPGVPTEKGAYGDPENTGVGYNAVLTELGNHDVPQGWIQTPHPNTTPNTNWTFVFLSCRKRSKAWWGYAVYKW